MNAGSNIQTTSVVLDAQTITTSETVTCTATVRDEEGIPVEGETVNWTSDSADVTFTLLSGQTDPNGETATTASCITAGTVSIIATSQTDPLVSGEASLQVTPVPPDSYKLAPSSVEPLVALPGHSLTVSVQVMDGNGVPLGAGFEVSWSSIMSDVLQAKTSMTDNRGIASMLVTYDGSGVFEVFATIDTQTVASTVRFSTIDIKPVNVTNGMDGVLDEYDLAMGVQVIIDKYPQARVNDEVIFHWDDMHSTSTYIDDINKFPIVIDISNDFPPNCLVDGEYCLFYEVVTESGNIAVSDPFNIEVQAGPVPSMLPAPEFVEGNDGWINSREAGNGTPILISYPDMAVNDSLKVYWQGYDEGGVAVANSSFVQNYIVTVDDEVNQQCIVSIDAQYIEPIVYGSAEAYYQLTPESGGSIATSEVADINVDVQF